nr:T9SS type A sorting domain-containing protein [Bacteroidota bacterium]
KGFTNTPGSGWDYDVARIAILERMADAIWEFNPEAYVILEHFTDNSEEKVLANYGMMTWGNLNYNYNEATMGWNSNSDFSWISWQQRGYDYPHLVGYMESHDEERLMAKNLNYGNSSGGYNITDTTIALQRMELAGAFFFTIPGPKMMWQFCELGYDYHINYPGTIGGSDHRLDPKPIRWDYQQDERRAQIYSVYSYLMNLRNIQEAFHTHDFSLSVNGAMKKIHLDHSSMNVTILGNFDVNDGNITPSFQHTGTWYDYFAEDSIYVTGTNDQIPLDAGEYKIYTDVFLGTPGIVVGMKELSASTNALQSIYPNPSTGQFNIELKLEDFSCVQLNIYDVTGRLVDQVYSGHLTAGSHSMTWTGHGENGGYAPKSIYFAELSVNGIVEVRKLVLR